MLFGFVVISSQHLLELNLELTNMNPDNYPVVTVFLGEMVSGRLQASAACCWRGVNLRSPEVLLFQAWLKRTLNVVINHKYYNSPFPFLHKEPRRLQSNAPWERCWHHSNICFLQAQARKIQKCWRNLPTEVAMPCAEDVEQ